MLCQLNEGLIQDGFVGVVFQFELDFCGYLSPHQARLFC